MRFYVREVIGWGLLALGLFVFYKCYTLLTPVGQVHYVVEVPELAVIGFILFRGGIHLIKVAVAARVCLQAQRRLSEEPPPAAKEPGAPSARRTTLPR